MGTVEGGDFQLSNSLYSLVGISKVSIYERLKPLSGKLSQFDWLFETEAIRSSQKDVKTMSKYQELS